MNASSAAYLQPWSVERRPTRQLHGPDGLDGPRILAEISEDALRDLFGGHGRGDSLVQACQIHFDAIEAKALMRHRVEPFKPVKLDTRDFAISARSAGTDPS